MIEILNIVPIQKGSLLASCSAHILPWKITFHNIKIFEKGAQRWINMPAKEFTNDVGEIKYSEHITFDSDSVKNSFRNQIMGAVDKFLQGNPNMKPEDAIKETNDFPF